MTAALHAALRQAFSPVELAQLHNEADRELNAATDYDLWSRLVDTLFYANHDENDNPQSIPGQPDGIEDGSRDMPDPAKAGERILAYVSNMGDGLYHAAAGQPLYGRDLESVVREVKRLRGECVRLDEDNTGLGRALTDARAEVNRLTAYANELKATVEMWEKTGETISHHIPEHYDGEGSFVECLIEWAGHANEVVMAAHAWRKRGRLVQDGDRLNSAVERIYPSDYCV